MDVPTQIFKAYDIRGLVDKEITLTLAKNIGRAFATLLIRENPGKELTVAVGRDMRETSITYQSSLSEGLTESGVNVVDVGLVSTPAFYFSVEEAKADGGVMVTASHNPVEYNGFKLTRAQAKPIGGDTGIQDIRTIIESETYEALDRKGEASVIENIPAKSGEMEFQFAGGDPVDKMKIVADSGNGMGAQYLDEFFGHIDADVTRMYWEFDGSFPNHEPNPMHEGALDDLQAKVKELGADVGIATDGDGDRIFFVDNEGEIVPPAVLRGMLAQIMLRKHPGATICYDIRPGKITEDMIREAGGIPSITKVGHSLIKEQMLQEKAVFGGESSGHFFYAFSNGVYEGPVTVATQILQEITLQGKTLAEIVRPLKEKYSHSGEINFAVSDKEAVLAAIKSTYNDGEISELDGVTVTYPNVWFNVRASNTENKIRLNLEAVDKETMETKRDEVSALIKGI